MTTGWPEAKKAQLKTMREAGAPIPEIARALNVTIGAVGYRRNQMDLPSREVAALSAERDARIKKLHAQGHDHIYIARRMRVTPDAMRKRLRKLGCTQPKPKAVTVKKKDDSQERANRLAKTIGKSPEWSARLLKAFGAEAIAGELG